jgi:hypothetical protein
VKTQKEQLEALVAEFNAKPIDHLHGACAFFNEDGSVSVDFEAWPQHARTLTDAGRAELAREEEEEADLYRWLERRAVIEHDGTGNGDGYSITCYKIVRVLSLKERRAEGAARRAARDETKRRDSALERAKASMDWQASKTVRLFEPGMGGEFKQMQAGDRRVRSKDGATVVCLEAGHGWYVAALATGGVQ